MKKSFSLPLLAFTFGLTIQLAAAQQVDKTKEEEAIKQLIINYENA